MARTRDRPALVWLYRIFLGLNFCSAVGFIVYALLLENPPSTALPLGMLIVGIVGLVSVVIGLLGSLRANCCITLYLWLGSLLTLAELGMTLSMFFNFHNTVNDIWKSNHAKGKEKKEISSKVSAGRWYFLVVCCLQFISILVAVAFKFCGRQRDFESFEDNEKGSDGQSSNAGNSSIQLQKLQASISGRQAHSFTTSPSTAAYASSKLNKSTTQKMAAKYGEYTSEFNNKGFFSRMFK
ncbi:hypothetical protein ABPG75_008287 [Micractinium tetrahymenae]